MGEAGLRPTLFKPARDLWARFVDWVVMSPVVWLVVAADLLGAVLGYVYWYGDRLAETPWYLWIFIPDCPLAATFMAGALVAFHYGRRWDFLGLLAAGTCIKYGVWTVVLWIANDLRGGSYDLESVVMSVTHLIMIVQGLMLTGLLRFRPVPVVLASLFLILNDVVDYATVHAPRVPRIVGVEFMSRVSIAMTVIIVVFWTVMAWVFFRRKRQRATASGGREFR